MVKKTENKDTRIEETAQDKLYSEKSEEKVSEDQKEQKEEVSKKQAKNEKQKIKKKFEAVANARSLPISKKHAMYICSFIKGKTIDKAIEELEKVSQLKLAVPFKGEIPHRKGMMSGRYPVNAAKEFIYVLKGLKGNAIVNGLDIEKTIIYLASANLAHRPVRAGGKRAKRTHVFLKAREIKEIKE